MPSPVLQDVHVAAALTNIAVAYVQDASSYIAEAVFPMVPVQHQTDKYFVWGEGDFFRDEATKRADATESAGSGVNLTTQSYSADVWALHQDIGPQVRSNADPAVEIDVAVTKQLMQKLMIRRDRIFATSYMTASVWSQDVTGTTAALGTVGSTTTVQWDDDAASDPFTDIATQQTYILTNTGFMPNKLVLSWNGLSSAAQTSANYRQDQIYLGHFRRDHHAATACRGVRYRTGRCQQGGLQHGGRKRYRVNVDDQQQERAAGLYAIGTGTDDSCGWLHFRVAGIHRTKQSRRSRIANSDELAWHRHGPHGSGNGL